MDHREIKRLLAILSAAEVNEFSLETADYKLALKRGQSLVHVVQASGPSVAPASGPPAPSPGTAGEVPRPEPSPTGSQPETVEAAASTKLVEVTAPIVGTFYAAPSPDAPAYVRVGDHVKPGAVMCIIEAMKLMNEIEAEVAGVVREVLVNNDDPVEYGQALFRIEPD